MCPHLSQADPRQWDCWVLGGCGFNFPRTHQATSQSVAAPLFPPSQPPGISLCFWFVSLTQPSMGLWAIRTSSWETMSSLVLCPTANWAVRFGVDRLVQLYVPYSFRMHVPHPIPFAEMCYFVCGVLFPLLDGIIWSTEVLSSDVVPPNWRSLACLCAWCHV